MLALVTFLSPIKEVLTSIAIPIFVVSHVPITTPVILGNDFINGYVEQLHVAKRELLMKNGVKIPMAVVSRGVNSFNTEVRSLKDYTIPPNTELVIDAKVCTISISSGDKAEEQEEKKESSNLTCNNSQFTLYNRNNYYINTDDSYLPVTIEEAKSNSITDSNEVEEELKESVEEVKGKLEQKTVLESLEMVRVFQSVVGEENKNKLFAPIVALDGIVEIGEDNTAEIRIANYSPSPYFIGRDDLMGTIETTTVPIDTIADSTTISMNESAVSSMTGSSFAPEFEEENGLDSPPTFMSPPDSAIDEIELSDSIKVSVNRTPLNEEQRERLIHLLMSNIEVFSTNPKAPLTSYSVEHRIDTGEHAPIFDPVRRTPPAYQKITDDEVAQMEANGIIRRSKSPWSANLVLVKKKDESQRVCADYRRLNVITKKDKYPLPRIDDTLDALSRATWFTTLEPCGCLLAD